MLSFFLRKSCALFFACCFFCAIIPVAAQAESLALTFDKTTQTTQLAAGNTAAAGTQNVTQTITLYPDAYSSRSGQSENIYDFGKKTFTVVNHNAKIYTVYPLHSIAVFRDRDRLQRLNMKVSMYHQKASTALPLSVLMQDVDIDMLLAADKSTKTADKIKTQTEGNKTAYTDGTNTLATVETGSTPLPAALRKTYAHLMVYEFSMHPVIKKSAAAQEKIFQSLNFTNRDIFRNRAVNYNWALTSAAAGDATAPEMPADYTRMYNGDRDVDAAFKTAQTPYVFDAADLQQKTTEWIQKQQYLHAFLYAQIIRLSMKPADFAKHQAAFSLPFKAAQTFERAAYLAVIQTPDTPPELKQYLDIFEKTKPRAAERAWLLDYYGARHTDAVLSKQKKMTRSETEQLAGVRGHLLQTLKNLPYLPSIYQSLGDKHDHAMEIPTAMLYWTQVQILAPESAGAKTFAALKADAERDFPEYF